MQSFCNILFCHNIGYIKILYHSVLSSRHLVLIDLGRLQWLIFLFFFIWYYIHVWSPDTDNCLLMSRWLVHWSHLKFCSVHLQTFAFSPSSLFYRRLSVTLLSSSLHLCSAGFPTMIVWVKSLISFMNVQKYWTFAAKLYSSPPSHRSQGILVLALTPQYSASACGKLFPTPTILSVSQHVFD